MFKLFSISNEIDLTGELPSHCPITKPTEQQTANSRYRCGYCHQTSNWKHVIERHCRLVHNTFALIEKFSDDDQLFHCYKPMKRRSDTCIETVTTAKRMMPDESVGRAVAYTDQSYDGDNRSNLPENDRPHSRQS